MMLQIPVPDHRLASLAAALGPLDAQGRAPRYRQLERALAAAIDARLIGTHEALPAERDLATAFQVSRITVRKALAGLAAAGLVDRRRGSGNFVLPRVEKHFSQLTSFSEDMRSRGRAPRSQWLARTRGTVTPEEALALAAGPGTPVYRFHRLRYADERPMALEYSTILASALSGPDDVDTSLYEALARHRHRPERALQRLRAILLRGADAALLQARDGDAGLLVERVGSLRDGRAIEFTRSYYRGDTYDFIAELSAP